MLTMAPDELATHPKTNSVRLEHDGNIIWDITTHIALASPHEPVRKHVGHVGEWDDETYDEDVDAIGRATSKGKKCDGKGNGKRKAARKRIVPKEVQLVSRCATPSGNLPEQRGLVGQKRPRSAPEAQPRTHCDTARGTAETTVVERRPDRCVHGRGPSRVATVRVERKGRHGGRRQR